LDCDIRSRPLDPSESGRFPERILFNNDFSPIYRTKGMFLVLHKERFNLDGITSFEKEVADILNFKYKLKEEFFDIRVKPIQHKFQNYTGSKLFSKYGNRLKKVQYENMSDYDWKVDNLRIEVKSDRNLCTGNIALELIRDYKDNNETNIGSVLKTKSTFWQEYFFDKKSLIGSSEVYLAKQLQDETDKALEVVKNQLGFDVDISNF